MARRIVTDEERARRAARTNSSVIQAARNGLRDYLTDPAGAAETGSEPFAVADYIMEQLLSRAAPRRDLSRARPETGNPVSPGPRTLGEFVRERFRQRAEARAGPAPAMQVPEMTSPAGGKTGRAQVKQVSTLECADMANGTTPAATPQLPPINWSAFFDVPEAHIFMTRARDALVREGVAVDKAQNIVGLLVANIAHDLRPTPKRKRELVSVAVDVYEKGDLLPRLTVAPGTPALGLAEHLHCAIVDALGVLRMVAELVSGEDEQNAINCAHRTLAIAKGMACSLEEAIGAIGKDDEPPENLVSALIAASRATRENDDA